MDLLPFDEYVRSLDRKRMSAGVLFHDGDGRVLLVEPSYKAHWEIPGGAVDAGESPWAAARREVREELGIDRALGRLLVIDYVPADGRMPEGMAFVFDGGDVTAEQVSALDLTDPEIVSAGLFHIGAATLTASLAHRLVLAVEALRTGELLLCDDGTPVSRR